MTLVAIDRLRSGREIASVLHGRRQRGGRLLALHAKLRADDGPARMAVVASRRVGGAVERNRAKRLVRAAAPLVPWRPGLDLVVVARRDCATSRLEPVRVELSGLADRMGLLSDAA